MNKDVLWIFKDLPAEVIEREIDNALYEAPVDLFIQVVFTSLVDYVRVKILPDKYATLEGITLLTVIAILQKYLEANQE